MNKKIIKVISLLEKKYPKVKIALNFKNVFQLLIATILSAQCKDERVNKVTSKLFKKYKTPKDFKNADLKELENDIKSTGFYKMKAKAIKKSSEIIVDKFKGKVPDDMNSLLKLKGVARKTANVILGIGYKKPEGIVVDTHVRRITLRLGFTNLNNPDKIEKDLKKIVPKRYWIKFPLLLMNYGREICKAKNPKCNECILKRYCNYYKSNKKI